MLSIFFRTKVVNGYMGVVGNAISRLRPPSCVITTAYCCPKMDQRVSGFEPENNPSNKSG